MVKTKSPITRLGLILLEFGGSAYGNGKDDAEAIKHAMYHLRDFGKLKKDAVVKVGLYDYEPYAKMTWSTLGVVGVKADGTEETISPLRVAHVDAKGREIKPVT